MRAAKVGIAWYKEADYAALRELLKDGDGLPESYDEWLQMAENGLNEIIRQGHRIVKVNIDLKSFPAWCQTRGLELSAEARAEFTLVHVRRASSD